MESPLFPLPASPRLKKVSNAGTYPSYTAVNGTFTTVGATVTFDNATQRGPSGPQAGDFLYSSSNNQVRRIKESMSAQNTAQLDESFTTNVTSAEDNLIVLKDQRYRGIGFFVSAAGACVVDGTAYLVTDPSVNWYNDDGLDPIAYDATGSELMLVIQK